MGALHRRRATLNSSANELYARVARTPRAAREEEASCVYMYGQRGAYMAIDAAVVLGKRLTRVKVATSCVWAQSLQWAGSALADRLQNRSGGERADLRNPSALYAGDGNNRRPPLLNSLPPVFSRLSLNGCVRAAPHAMRSPPCEPYRHVELAEAAVRFALPTIRSSNYGYLGRNPDATATPGASQASKAP